jgi:predicted nucleotide-binding protein
MEKRKIYRQAKFSSRILRKALDSCTALSKDKNSINLNGAATIDNEQWSFRNAEEFLTHYAHEKVVFARLEAWWDGAGTHLYLFFSSGDAEISVGSESRASIETVFSIFEEAPSEDKITPAPNTSDAKPVIFIGHGRSNQWEKLKSHLQDKHELSVESYETGARAGHTIRDILDRMSRESSLALLILTGEDRTEDGIRARQNVIHECGLFQGRLGFDRAIMLVEEGIELASNFDGIQQLRFKKGRISEVFGDVVATIRREFGPI